MMFSHVFHFLVHLNVCKCKPQTTVKIYFSRCKIVSYNWYLLILTNNYNDLIVIAFSFEQLMQINDSLL